MFFRDVSSVLRNVCVFFMLQKMSDSSPKSDPLGSILFLIKEVLANHVYTLKNGDIFNRFHLSLILFLLLVMTNLVDIAILLLLSREKTS